MKGRNGGRRPGPSDLMPQPPKTAHEMEMDRKIRELMHGMADGLHQQNLNAAVLLAQEAARGEGELIEHFAELGRRFAGTLGRHRKPKRVPNLHVVEGGAS